MTTVEFIIKLPDSIFEQAIVETIIILEKNNNRCENVHGIVFHPYGAEADFSSAEKILK